MVYKYEIFTFILITAHHKYVLNVPLLVCSVLAWYRLHEDVREVSGQQTSVTAFPHNTRTQDCLEDG
jgi:hypothetical protein